MLRKWRALLPLLCAHCSHFLCAHCSHLCAHCSCARSRIALARARALLPHVRAHCSRVRERCYSGAAGSSRLALHPPAQRRALGQARISRRARVGSASSRRLSSPPRCLRAWFRWQHALKLKRAHPVSTAYSCALRASAATMAPARAPTLLRARRVVKSVRSARHLRGSPRSHRARRTSGRRRREAKRSAGLQWRRWWDDAMSPPAGGSAPRQL